MKTLLAAVLLAVLATSPALAASPAACKNPKADILAALDRVHKDVPDIVVHQYRDPALVAAGVQFINDQPPPTNYSADAIFTIKSEARGSGFAILVDHGCAVTSLHLSNDEVDRFIRLITKMAGTPV